MKILVENSTWVNIGDGFYQYSLFHLFKTLFPHHDIQMLDGPIARAFKLNGRFTKNALNLMRFQTGDMYVFSGPILGKNFVSAYGPKIENIVNSGSHYLILSAHAPSDPAIVDANKRLLRSYPPLAFSSRDRDTYKLYSDIAQTAYDGICGAFFASKVLSVPEVNLGCKYITLSTYNEFDPSLSVPCLPLWDGNIETATIHIAERPSPYWRIARHFEWLRGKQQQFLGDFLIIRPHHDLSYYWSHLNFVRPHSFLSYNPLSYLSLYQSTSLTISNRVHACVATLSFGNPIFFWGQTERAGVFERVGLVPHGNEIVRLPKGILDDEYSQFCHWLTSVVNSVWNAGPRVAAPVA